LQHALPPHHIMGFLTHLYFALEHTSDTVGDLILYCPWKEKNGPA
jgi:hypothetical protein